MKNKSKKKKFLMDVFPCSFPISSIKNGGKIIIVIIFPIRGEGKCEMNYLKKKVFFPFRELFHYFLSEICRNR